VPLLGSVEGSDDANQRGIFIGIDHLKNTTSSSSAYDHQSVRMSARIQREKSVLFLERIYDFSEIDPVFLPNSLVFDLIPDVSNIHDSPSLNAVQLQI